MCETKTITDNLATLSRFASALANELNMWDAPDDHDYWHAFSDFVDLNIFKYGSDELKCCAYPVENGFINTSTWVEVPLEKR